MGGSTTVKMVTLWSLVRRKFLTAQSKANFECWLAFRASITWIGLLLLLIVSGFGGEAFWLAMFESKYCPAANQCVSGNLTRLVDVFSFFFFLSFRFRFLYSEFNFVTMAEERIKTIM